MGLYLPSEAIAVAFCTHALLPLDDDVYALPVTISQLNRPCASSLHSIPGSQSIAPVVTR